MTTLFKKVILFAMMASMVSNAELQAQSTTTTNDYTPTGFLGWGENSGDLLFKVNNNTSMVLQNNTGNFGIGTSNPAAKLHVVSTVSTTPVAHFQTNTGFTGLVVKENGKIAVGSANGSGSQFDVRAQGLPSTFENLFLFTVSDAVDGGNVRDYVSITNATNADSQFAPLFASCYGSGSSIPNLNFRAQTPFANDIGTTPMSKFDAYLLSSSDLVVNRPLVQFTNRGHIRVSIAPNGSIYSGSLPNSSFSALPTTTQLHVVGSGTTSATFTAKFQNNNGTDILTIRNDNKIIYTDGTQGAGKVLTSDASGAASWQPSVVNSQWISSGNDIYYSNGKVLIGNPGLANFKGTPGTYQLYVQGGILTEKVKAAVATSNDWSDYVFAEEYELKSLKEVEKFIKTNKHLPNVPSADEVVKEGIDMAKMDAKLLEKIEELTLYLIELDKKNADQEKKIKELSSKIKALQNK